MTTMMKSEKKSAIYLIYIMICLLPVWTGTAFGAEKGNKEKTPRFFVLEYSLHRYTDEVRESTAHVFNYVLTEQDHLLILAGERTLYFESVSDKVKAFGVAESVLKKQAAWTRHLMQAEIKSMGDYIAWVRKQAKEDVHPGATYGDWKGVHPHYYMKYLKNSIERYLDMLTGYKDKFLLPDVVKYSRLFGHLEKVTGEKWYISFYQPPLLPGYARENREMIDLWIKELSQRGWLDEQDYVKKLNRLQDNIDDVFEVSSRKYDPLFDEMANQFHKGGFTFQTVLLSMEQDEKVKAGVRNALKKRLDTVASMTGGILCTADKLNEAQASSPLLVREEIKHRYKSSAYLAKRLQQIAKTGNTPAEIRIEDISFKRKTLSMIINGFARDNGKIPAKDQKGKLNVLVRIIDGEGNIVFDKKKTLLAKKESVALSLNFKWLKSGKYFLITDAKDLITGKAWAQVSGFEVR